jgi:DNA-binding NarL/FixJ family response regulator
VIRVVVVDDDPLVRTGLELILSAQPDIAVVGEAGDGHTAQTVVRQHRPDVVLMDVRMPGTDGLAATRALLAAAGAPWRIIMLTTFDLDEYVHAAIIAGASGFLLKDSSPERLVAAVRQVATGDLILAPVLIRRLIARYTRGTDQTRLAALTGREREVLTLIAEGLSNAEIAARLFITPKTTEHHLAATYRKLGISSRRQLPTALAPADPQTAEPHPG